MAVFTAQQLTDLRHVTERSLGSVHYTKAQINAALQAIEDQMQLTATKTAIGSAIETSAVGVFSAAEKVTLFAIWADTFATRQGIS